MVSNIYIHINNLDKIDMKCFVRVIYRTGKYLSFINKKDYDDDCYNILLNTNDINADFICIPVRHLNWYRNKENNSLN